MDLIQKANKLGYKHYTEFTVEELDNLSLENSNKQIEYYFIQKWLRDEHNIHLRVDDFIDDETGIEWDYEIVIIGTDLDEKGHYIPLISYDMNNSIERKFKTYEEALEKSLQEALKLI